MLNLDKLSLKNTPRPGEEGTLHTYWIELGNEIKVEKRVVNSLTLVTGEIFGLQ